MMMQFLLLFFFWIFSFCRNGYDKLHEWTRRNKLKLTFNGAMKSQMQRIKKRFFQEIENWGFFYFQDYKKIELWIKGQILICLLLFCRILCRFCFLMNFLKILFGVVWKWCSLESENSSWYFYTGILINNTSSMNNSRAIYQQIKSWSFHYFVYFSTSSKVNKVSKFLFSKNVLLLLYLRNKFRPQKSLFLNHTKCA